MFKPDLLQLEKRHLLRRLAIVESYDGPYVTINGKRLLLLGSNAYLGLADNPELCKVACAAMERYGFCSGVSTLLYGNSALHEGL